MSSDPRIRRSDPAVSLRVCGLTKHYSLRRKLWERRSLIPAVNNVSFEIPGGNTLALIGSSGSGKSTIARCVTRLERPDTGEIWLGRCNIAQLRSSELRPLRAQIQLIFQDPITSMNPRMSASEIIEEPMLIQRRGNHRVRRARAGELMKEVGLSPEWLDRRVTEFSGGQQQRLAIARALTLSPKVLVLDEALSGLDLTTRAQIIGLLSQLQATRSLTYVLISHDLALVARLADSVAVMSKGRIVEHGPTREIIVNPLQPETQELVEAAVRGKAAWAASGGSFA